jgi:hypothetical protein
MYLHLLLPLFYTVPFFFIFQDKWLFLQFVIGVGLGFLLFLLDRFLHVFFIQPESEFSQLVRGHWQQRKIKKIFHTFLTGRDQQNELITRSIFFLIVYVGLALYVMTSTGSVLGMGMILGIGLHFCLDFWSYRQNHEKFNHHFFWQMKRKLEEKEITYLVIIFSLFFLLLSMLAIKS